MTDRIQIKRALVSVFDKTGLEDLLDTGSALAWLAGRPRVRLRTLDSVSPFAAAWIIPGEGEPLSFESPAEALKRLHARLSAQR